MFSASVLAALEKATGASAVDHFDLIAGTSTGGVLALGLAMGMPAARIREFYVDHAGSIFPGVSYSAHVIGSLRQLLWPKRSRQRLALALETVFGDQKLRDARCRLLIPTYDVVAGRVYVIKTAHHPRLTFDIDARVVDCALATSAAPTYFPASGFPAHPGASYVDGGVWANCPVLVGLIEATHFLRVPIENIDILSIGTTTPTFSITGSVRTGGIWQWKTALVDLLLRAQAEASIAAATLLTSGALHRIDATVSRGRFAMDDIRHLSDMIALGDGEARKREHLDIVASRFLNGVKSAPFAPNYASHPAKA